MNAAKRVAMTKLLVPAAAMVALMPTLAGINALLRDEGYAPHPDLWSNWSLTPGITLSLIVAAALYISGQTKKTRIDSSGYETLRHCSYFGGLAAIFLALQSPIEEISDHLFVVHQVEHMLLRTIAPILLMAAAPQAALLRGTPDVLRRFVVAPLFSNPTLRLLGFLGQPAVATFVFIATTYFWMIPRFHDLAIMNEPIHWVWHITLLLSGLIFFWRVLDSRPYPQGLSLGARLFMFWFASIGNIILGFYLSFKTGAIYHAYDVKGRLWGISPLDDETYGGLTMWIMGGMMFGATAVLTVYRWGLQEERRVARGANAAALLTSAQVAEQRRASNRRTAIGLVCFFLTALLLTFTVVLAYRYSFAIQGLLRV